MLLLTLLLSASERMSCMERCLFFFKGTKLKWGQLQRNRQYCIFPSVLSTSFQDKTIYTVIWILMWIRFVLISQFERLVFLFRVHCCRVIFNHTSVVDLGTTFICRSLRSRLKYVKYWIVWHESVLKDTDGLQGMKPIDYACRLGPFRHFLCCFMTLWLHIPFLPYWIWSRQSASRAKTTKIKKGFVSWK